MARPMRWRGVNSGLGPPTPQRKATTMKTIKKTALTIKSNLKAGMFCCNHNRAQLKSGLATKSGVKAGFALNHNRAQLKSGLATKSGVKAGYGTNHNRVLLG